MPPMSGPVVRQGDKGPRVRAVQFLPRARGAGIDADGSFGPMTDGAVRHFQTQRGLSVDWVVGEPELAGLTALRLLRERLLAGVQDRRIGAAPEE